MARSVQAQPASSPSAPGISTATAVEKTQPQSTQPLQVVYPRPDHETTAQQIFLIGTAPPEGQVWINGKAIARNAAGHFAPSFPLQVGKNQFFLKHSNGQTLTISVTRKAAQPEIPQGLAFGKDSLFPTGDISRQPGELMCFSAIANPQAQVRVNLGQQTIPLQLQPMVDLPSNTGVLTGKIQPQEMPGRFVGCGQLGSTATNKVENTNGIVNLGQPEYELEWNQKRLTQKAPGKVEILSPTQPMTIEVIADAGVARTGASTDYSRLTPLPKGTRATVTGTEGDWYRLDYGAWIRKSETKPIDGATPVQSTIRGIRSQNKQGWTEVVFPLQSPVPLTVQQGDRTFTLTLHNVTAQTDTMRLVTNPVIERLDWQQTRLGQIDYRFVLKSDQQWGYKLRYEGSTLVLSLRNPPQLTRNAAKPLTGVTILLDPGHGGPEDLGSVGFTGLPEKEVALKVSKLVRDRLVQRGATVIMTREADVDLWPNDRAAMIQKLEPTISVSIHYNALPDDGDAIRTKGVSAFWYHSQAQSLAAFLQDAVVNRLGRSPDGVTWNNLALTRPAVAPSILIELGYMINPDEFEWIRNDREQLKLADTLADGITQWFQRSNPRSSQ
ncbi:N-acetylmuramoyl-L-alanine amidase [Alkalinema pantanalense]|uniref:N-acetylmuramoyl-L-alanine amidase n=1 Tax=Alkalinema pantanalense TaxID=1620705 RepID=UPI003D6DEBE2